MLPIRIDRVTREWYSQGAGIYRIVPAAVARPEDVATLVRVLEWARQRGMSVVPRGAGSAMDGSSVGDGVVIDLAGLASRAPQVDPKRRVARVDAGVALSRVAAAAAPHGLRLGPDPSSAAWATVGGSIATNAAGARSYRLGAMDRWVEELTVITVDGALDLARRRPADPAHPGVDRFRREAEPLLRAHRGTVLARVPATTKDTAGYGLRRYHAHGDLLDLFVGSEGTLGIITEAVLRLEEIPPHRATLELSLPERALIAPVVRRLAPLDVTSVELFDRSFLVVLGRDPAAAVLLVDFEATDADDLERRLAAAVAAVRSLSVTARVARRDDEIAALWSLRHRASPILAGLTDGRQSLQVVEDGCVPLASLADYLDAVDEACRDAGLDAVMFGHAGDGHVHVNLLPDLGRADWFDAVRHVYTAVTEALVRLQGTPAGEHGAGRLRAPLLERFVGREALACMRAIKRAFDPGGLLNPGVILPDGSDPLGRLKVGADAAMIDPAIAARLQRIEAERRWAESRWDAGEG